MNLDLRIPMGLMFSIIGVILTAFGAGTYNDTALYARSLGVNANLWWGIVLLIFGLIMFFMGRRGQKRVTSLPAEPADESAPRRGH